MENIKNLKLQFIEAFVLFLITRKQSFRSSKSAKIFILFLFKNLSKPNKSVFIRQEFVKNM